MGLLAACAGGDAPAEGPAVAEPRIVGLAPHLSLTSRPGYPIVDPISVDASRENEYVVADRSERAIWIYASDGTFKRQLAGAGYAKGQLQTLYGSALLGDVVGAFDVNTDSISFFELSGALQSTTSLWVEENGSPRTIRALDDSLVLVVRYPTTGERRSLISIVDRQGRLRSELPHGRSYYPRNPAVFSVLSMPIADARNGVVLAGFSGSDSLFAYDYEGRVIAAGHLTDRAGVRITSYERYAGTVGGLERGEVKALGEHLRATGSVSLSQIVMLDGTRALIQLDYVTRPGQKRRSFADSSVLVPVQIDRRTRRIVAGLPAIVQGRLVGRTANSGGMVVRPGQAPGVADLLIAAVEK